MRALFRCKSLNFDAIVWLKWMRAPFQFCDSNIFLDFSTSTENLIYFPSFLAKMEQILICSETGGKFIFRNIERKLSFLWNFNTKIDSCKKFNLHLDCRFNSLQSKCNETRKKIEIYYNHRFLYAQYDACFAHLHLCLQFLCEWNNFVYVFQSKVELTAATFDNRLKRSNVSAKQKTLRV